MGGHPHGGALPRGIAVGLKNQGHPGALDGAKAARDDRVGKRIVPATLALARRA